MPPTTKYLLIEHADGNDPARVVICDSPEQRATETLRAIFGTSDVPGETEQDREYRRVKLREFGARPYPMPFVRTRELMGFQRWIIGAYDKRISWSDWKAAKYQPSNLTSLAA